MKNQPTHSHASVMKERAGFRRQIAALTRANRELAERFAESTAAADLRNHHDIGRLDFWRGEAAKYQTRYEALLKLPEPERPGMHMSLRVEREIRLSRDQVIQRVGWEEDSHKPGESAVIGYAMGFAHGVEAAARLAAHDPALRALIIRLAPDWSGS